MTSSYNSSSILDASVCDASALRSQRQLASEIMARWHDGARADARAFLDDQKSDKRWHKSVVVDLAYEEFCLRTEAGEAVDLEAFIRRFPTVEHTLQKMIAVHNVLDDQLGFVNQVPPPPWPAVGEKFI